MIIASKGGQTSQSDTPIVIATIVLASLLSVATALRALGRHRRESLARYRARLEEEALDARLDLLSRSMSSSARLVEEISAELEARAATVRQLQEDAKVAEALAALHKDQAEAVRRMLDAELAAQAKGIRGDAIKIGIAGFIAGGGVSFLVTLLVHPLR